MGVDHYECTLCGEVLHSDSVPIVYTCELTEEEINSQDFDQRGIDDRAIAYDRVCEWCVKKKGIKKTASGFYYYEAHAQLDANLYRARAKLLRAMQEIQRLKSKKCADCKEAIENVTDIGLCGSCGESIHDGCGYDSGESEDESGDDEKDNGSGSSKHSYAVTLELEVYTCVSCKSSKSSKKRRTEPPASPNSHKKVKRDAGEE